MAKTAYRTWVAGEVVTASMLNEQVRDNGNALWESFVARTTVDVGRNLDIDTASTSYVTMTNGSFVVAALVPSVLYVHFVGSCHVPFSTRITVKLSDGVEFVENHYYNDHAGNIEVPISAMMASNVAVGNHTVTVQAKVSAGTGVVNQGYCFAMMIPTVGV